MKKVFIKITLILIILIPTIVFASEIDVQLNGQNIDFTDENGNEVNPQIVNNRTMVPMRKIFEELGATINWIPESKTIIANKDNTTIKLQINNKIAECITNGVIKQIQLDSEPLILNNRTLVPVRFIAESLNKQVGWDSSNNTVIIIDYLYFFDKLKTSSPALYDFLNIVDQSKNYEKVSEMNISSNYTDLLDNSSKTFTSNYKINEKNINNSCEQIVSIKFLGNSDLASEIKTEGWEESTLNLKFENNEIKYNTNNNVLAKILGINANENKIENIKNLKLIGGENNQEITQMLADVDINSIESFNKLENSFECLSNTFKFSDFSVSDNGEKVFTWHFSSNNLDLEKEGFDISKIDNILIPNTYVRTYNFINNKIFNYDFDINELLYESSEVSINGDFKFIVKDGVLKSENINIKLQKINLYNEKYEYVINIVGGVK
jgi:hypothetical protein